jgi:PleD family two-component response regulator
MEGDKKKVMLIDNEQEFTDLIKSFLEPSCNCEVRVVPDGYNGVRLAAQLKPDLILLDVLMPAMNGFAILKKIKDNEETSSIPVMMITASSDEESVEKATALGCEDYIVKPINLEYLRDKVKEVLSRR